MAKDLSIAVLLDFYGELLTDKQNEALKLYYEEDCSLAEIADVMSVSRQGARDFIKRGEMLLEEFESKLGLAGRFARISKSIGKIEDCLKNEDMSTEILKYIEEIKTNL